MALFKARDRETAPEAAPPTRQEFEAFKTVVSIAFSAVVAAAGSSPGMADANPRNRFEKLAAAADLDSGERAELRGFLKRLDKAGTVESQRELEEVQERSAPPRHGFRPLNNWRG